MTCYIFQGKEGIWLHICSPGEQKGIPLLLQLLANNSHEGKEIEAVAVVWGCSREWHIGPATLLLLSWQLGNHLTTGVLNTNVTVQHHINF